MHYLVFLILLFSALSSAASSSTAADTAATDTAATDTAATATATAASTSTSTSASTATSTSTSTSTSTATSADTPTTTTPPATLTKQGMVATEQALASQVGLDVLKSGGNAIDAAVAVGYALAVVNPCCGNIGGGGLMTIHLATGKNIFLNFRERAPLAIQQKLFLDKNGNPIPEKSMIGYLAVATPGTVLGLETILKKYGTKSRRELIAPAIKLATDGFILSEGDIKLFSPHIKEFQSQPNVAAIFLKNNKPYAVGDRLIQKDLAKSLKLISDKGADGFYKGIIADAIVKASSANGGVLSLKDFFSYSVEEMNPITCTYRDYKIISAPPPSSGGITLCEILNILEAYPLKVYGFHTATSMHYIIEAMRLSFRDRNLDLGDPDFVKNSIDKLISKKYAADLRKEILQDKSSPSGSAAQPLKEDLHTTHYSIVDKFGNAVAVTYTLNSFFGAQVIAGNTGFFLNNEMDDFAITAGGKNQFGLVQGAANLVAPGKRPLSSMTPTVIEKNGKVVMVVGSVGGPKIITGTLETILNVIDFDMPLQAAVDAGRFHQQWLPEAVDIEEGAFAPSLLQQLKAMGYQFKEQGHWGAVEAILVDPKTGDLTGANDVRRKAGAALGY